MLLICVLALFSCQPDSLENTSVHKLDLSKRTVNPGMIESYAHSTTYLPIYSSIHTMSENETKSLTSTVSIHNMNLNDSLFVSKIDYYNTEGKYVRSYIKTPIFITPMETINIVVHQKDNVGGTGANFLIDWSLNNNAANPPLIEAIMIRTMGQQGISFTTRGIIMD